jgi:branched-chain amino acid aminotransferase
VTHLLVVDGRRVAPGEPAVAADDAGLLGHGAYESLRTYERRPFAVDRHLERLAHGLHLLGIETDLEALREELWSLAAAAGEAIDDELTIRIVVTATGTRVIEAMPLIRRPATVRAVCLPWRWLPHGPLEGIKAASTAQVRVARRHVASRAADDGLWLTPEDHVSEALAANVFAVVRSQLVTPPLSDGALAGVTRALILELFEAEERPLPLADLLAADEAFVSATSSPARALVEVEGQVIGTGRPGPRTGEIAESFARRALERVSGPASA